MRNDKLRRHQGSEDHIRGVFSEDHIRGVFSEDHIRGVFTVIRRKYEAFVTDEDNEQINQERNYERNQEQHQEQNQGTESRTKSGTKSEWNQELNQNEIRDKINQTMEQKMNQRNKIKIKIENKAGYQIEQILGRGCQIKTPVAIKTSTQEFWSDRSLMGDPIMVAQNSSSRSLLWGTVMRFGTHDILGYLALSLSSI